MCELGQHDSPEDIYEYILDMGMRPNQSREELIFFYRCVRHLLRKVSVVCEIGVEWGGTSAFLSHLLSGDGIMVGIDINSTVAGINIPKVREMIAPSVYQLIPYASTSTEALSMLSDILGERKIDVLFIDGDHRYDTVKLDYTNFHPFMRRPSIVAFHDIKMVSDTQNWPGHEMVGKYWDELLRHNTDHIEICLGNERNVYGIGLILIR